MVKFFDINEYIKLLDLTVFTAIKENVSDNNKVTHESDCKNPLFVYLFNKITKYEEHAIQFMITSFFNMSSDPEILKMNEELLNYFDDIKDYYYPIGYRNAGEIIIIAKDSISTPIYLFEHLDDETGQFVELYSDSNSMIITWIELYKAGFYSNLDLCASPKFDLKKQHEMHKIFNPTSKFWSSGKKKFIEKY